jgi:hypothetical protein
LISLPPNRTYHAGSEPAWIIKGDLVQDNHLKSKDIVSKGAAQPEIDYSPKPFSLGDQFGFGAKLFAVIGIIFLLLWFYEKAGQ